MNTYKSVCSVAVVLLCLTACNKRQQDIQTVPPPLAEQDEISYNHIITVGPDKDYTTISAAAAAAGDSTLIEVDAGLYAGDVALWQQKELYIRAVGGEVTLDANGASYGGKGIWEVATQGRMKVVGFTFKNAHVPDHNGAGIRLTSGNLIVDSCHFLQNETGLLTAASGTLTIRNSEFGYNGYGDGQSHDLYVGALDTLVVTGSYFHHANIGHLFKSRAKLSIVEYCLLADGNDANSLASYDLDLPSGGTNIVVGNIIQKSINSPNNSGIIAFAEESNTTWGTNLLYLSHNTVLNSKPSTNPMLLPSDSTPDNSIYMLNDLLSENMSMPATQVINVNQGNQTYQASEIDANYIPSTELYNRILNQLAPNIDQYLSSDLKARGISLIPTSEYLNNALKQLTSAPKIAGAIQEEQ